MIRPALLAAALLSLAACASDTRTYPSLAPRPIEKLGFAEPVVAPVPLVADPALDARIAAATATLDKIAAGFAADAARTEASARAARGAAVGSDPWLTAQTQLATLDDWRAQLSSLSTDLDEAATDRAAALQPDYPALATLRDRVQAEADRESATIQRLQASLPAA